MIKQVISFQGFRNSNRNWAADAHPDGDTGLDSLCFVCCSWIPGPGKSPRPRLHFHDVLTIGGELEYGLMTIWKPQQSRSNRKYWKREDKLFLEPYLSFFSFPCLCVHHILLLPLAIVSFRYQTKLLIIFSTIIHNVYSAKVEWRISNSSAWGGLWHHLQIG